MFRHPLFPLLAIHRSQIYADITQKFLSRTKYHEWLYFPSSSTLLSCKILYFVYYKRCYISVMNHVVYGEITSALIRGPTADPSLTKYTNHNTMWDVSQFSTYASAILGILIGYRLFSFATGAKKWSVEGQVRHSYCLR